MSILTLDLKTKSVEKFHLMPQSESMLVKRKCDILFWSVEGPCLFSDLTKKQKNIIKYNIFNIL